MNCKIAMQDRIFFSPDGEHIFLSERAFYWYRPCMRGELPTPRSISDFWIVEERGGPSFRETIGDEVLIGPSEVRYYLRVEYSRRGQQQPLVKKYPIKGYRLPGDEDRHLGITDLFPTVNLWHLPFPFETGTHSMVCHRLDPERVDKGTGKPYVYSVFEPACQHCHSWLLPGDPHYRSVRRTVDAYYNIAAGQKYCSPECRYAAQLKRQKYRYNYSRGNFKEIAPDGWINVREHLDMFGSSIPRISAADLPAALALYKSQIENSSRTSSPIDDLPRCDNCGGIIQRKRMKRSAGKGQFCSDRCRKAYKRRLEKKLAWAA
jgi:hypothetical protein